MRSGAIRCLSYALYKYILKILRLLALMYNLIHYLPQLESPLAITDRATLPRTLPRCALFMSQREADLSAVSHIQLISEDDASSDSQPTAHCAGRDDVLAEVGSQDVELLATSAQVDDLNRVYPAHMYCDQAASQWVERRWQPTVAPLTEDGAPSEDSDHSCSGQWVVENRFSDRAAGQSLADSLACFALALDWAAEALENSRDPHNHSDMAQPPSSTVAKGSEANYQSPPSAPDVLRLDPAREEQISAVRKFLSAQHRSAQQITLTTEHTQQQLHSARAASRQVRALLHVRHSGTTGCHCGVSLCHWLGL